METDTAASSTRQEQVLHSLTPERLEVIRDLDHFAATEVRLRSCRLLLVRILGSCSRESPNAHAANQPAEASGEVLAATGPPSEP